jgi:hypothetical protein
MHRYARQALWISFAAAIAAAVSVSAASSRAVTWTGWFSDESCAKPRVARGEIVPNNTACVRTCLEQGATPVFISKEAKDLFVVKDYAGLKEDVGFLVELTGVVDEAAKTLTVTSVKRLSEVVNQCGVPKRKQ